MSLQIKQIRYFQDGASKNYPSNTTLQNLASGAIFEDSLPIVHLGIQTIPGVEFFVNNSVDPIIVDSSGIFEINLEDKTEIDSLKFNKTKLSNLVQNDSNPNGYLIIDIVYDDEGLGV